MTKFETSAIHSGWNGTAAGGAASVPVYRASSYQYDRAAKMADVFAGKSAGYIYTRIANPTTTVLEARLSHLEDGIGCIVTASGMAAIASVAMGLLRAGDQIIASSGIFAGTVSLFAHTLDRFGIKTVFVNADSPEEFAENVTDRTGLIFIETIGNPQMNIPDVERISQVARQANIPLVVDNTAATPALFRPGQFGADVVVHSTTKFINGHGTAIGGAIIDTGNYSWAKGNFADIARRCGKAGALAFLSHLRNQIYRDLGGCASPGDSFAMLQGLETLAMRMDRHCSNAAKLAAYLVERKGIDRVTYPGLSHNQFYRRAERYFGGRGGGVLTFNAGSRDKAFGIIDGLQTAKNLANLGTPQTAVIHPASTLFADFPAAQRRQLGIDEGMIRVSAGLENIDDIINDFELAIKSIM